MLTSRTLINFRKHQIALSLRINKVWSQTLVRLIAHSRGMGVLKTMVKDSLSGILVGVVSLFSHHILFGMNVLFNFLILRANIWFWMLRMRVMSRLTLIDLLRRRSARVLQIAISPRKVLRKSLILLNLLSQVHYISVFKWIIWTLYPTLKM